VKGPASWQSSKYRPVAPSTRGDAASSTEVAAPCSTVFSVTPVLPDGSNEEGGASMWRPRPVPQIRPGLSALTVMPSAAQRLAASTAKRMFAVLDCAYASHGS
jgi:hypothetical protein